MAAVALSCCQVHLAASAASQRPCMHEHRRIGAVTLHGQTAAWVLIGASITLTVHRLHPASIGQSQSNSVRLFLRRCWLELAQATRVLSPSDVWTMENLCAATASMARQALISASLVGNLTMF